MTQGRHGFTRAGRALRTVALALLLALGAAAAAVVAGKSPAALLSTTDIVTETSTLTTTGGTFTGPTTTIVTTTTSTVTTGTTEPTPTETTPTETTPTETEPPPRRMTRWFVPGEFEDYVDESCGFPVLVHSDGDSATMQFTDADGTVVRAINTYPGLRITLTRLDTGEVRHVNLAGPGFTSFTSPDGSSGTTVGTGPWPWGSDPAGEPGIFILYGRWTYSWTSDGSTPTVSVGHVEDVCADLRS